ncbi:unnamed protein product [Acanthoscelides obtectus]|uniref:Transposase n=1 Tax=Acanthoscelides obtectus TaxID=200917 RepID=A0A9P0LLR3_ACAOB|nr:unnamed protein product [Acanthoscelides obtectus]CAK1686784.1 Histone-lysine N-methyltransferase SETMAR [Acanthoscelides obtectus]
MELNREHFRIIIYYNFQRQLSQQECLAELLSVFGNEAPHHSTISLTQENFDAVRKLIIEDRHVTYRETSIQKILHEELGKSRVNWCEKRLDRFNSGNSKKVYSIVSGDESWIYTSAVWVLQGEEKPTKVIRSRSVSKKMVATFVSKAGHAATISLNEQRTVTADWYTTICLPKVITELRKINPERRIILHQDNASSHTAQKTRQYLTEENVELLDHPPYSPNLSPNDFLTFPKIKNRLRGERFQSPEEAVDAFKNAVLDLPANEWNKCFENWFERMLMYIPRTNNAGALADIHSVYGFVNGNAAEAVREYARRFPNRRHPTRSVFVRVHRQIIENGFENLQRDQNINVRQRRFTRMILREFDRDPTTSVRRVSGALGISASHVHRVLRNDHRRPYHLQPVQGLQPGDGERRITFCQWILDRTGNNREFLSNVLWSDESCFTRRGVVNFHNQHMWSHENPHAVRERNFQHEFSVNVWIGIYRNRLFRPYLLPARLNAATFLEFLKAEHANMWDAVMLDLRRLAWSQLDGCPAHYSRIVRNWLDENYPERWIGRPDLNPLDFFVDMLIDRIRNACDEIRPYLNNAIPRSIIRTCELCIE